MDLKITPTDSNAENEGAWGNYRGVKLLIARANNSRYVAELRRLQRPYQKDLARGRHDNVQFEKDVCTAMSKFVLMDWKDFLVGDEEIPYTQENACNLLENDKDVREYISEFSLGVDNYIIEEAESVAKKL